MKSKQWVQVWVLMGMLLLGSLWIWGQTAQFPASVATDSQLVVAANNISTTLVGAIGSGTTSISVVSTSGMVMNMLLQIDTVGGSPEVVQVSSIGGTLTVVRGFDGTTAVAHPSGSGVHGYVSAWHHNALRVEVEAIEGVLRGSAGSGYLMVGDVPLSGASVSSTYTSVSQAGGGVTIATNAGGSGVYKLVMPAAYASTVTPCISYLTVSNGTVVLSYYSVNVSYTQLTYPFAPLIIYPGESAILYTGTGSCTTAFQTTTITFSPTSGLKQPKLYGLSAGNNTVYTTPAGTVALLLETTQGTLHSFANTPQFSFSLDQTGASLNISCLFAGVTFYGGASSGSGNVGIPASNYQYTLPPVLTTGTSFVIGSNANSTTAGIIGPLIFERPQ
jgi:hypothetical protein